MLLQGNDPFEYQKKINLVRSNAINSNSPILVEVKLTTLGYWYMESEGYPDGKFINYHGGPAPEVDEKDYPQLVSSNEDPLFLLNNYLSVDELTDISCELSLQLKEDVS